MKIETLQKFYLYGLIGYNNAILHCPKCFLLQKGTKAPQAAGKIHGDFEKGFIMAEVMKYTDFKEHDGVEAEVKVS